MLRKHLCRFAILLVLAPWLAGCPNSGSNSISGTVTYKDKPVTGAQMKFHYPDKKVFEISVKPDGTYVTTDAPIGTAKVTINTEGFKKVIAVQPPPMPKGEKDKQYPMPGGGGTGPVYMAIPSKYADVDKTPLSVEVKGGSNKKDFALTD